LSFINLKDKIVQVKIVYYGPGRCGKTTNLEYINRTYRKQIVSEMVSLKTHGDRTLFFDFLPFDMGQIKGYDIKIQLYTVPGQVKYNATRKLVLRGVDGIVFVADAMEKQREKNIRSLNQLHENLQSYKESIFKIPLVMQYNKVDLKEHGIPVLPTSVLEKDLSECDYWLQCRRDIEENYLFIGDFNTEKITLERSCGETVYRKPIRR
jgi:signal recognition particle receptor subunit beta